MNSNTNTQTNGSELQNNTLPELQSSINIFALPDSPDKTAKIKENGDNKVKDVEKSQKQLEDITASEDGKKLGLILGAKALIYAHNTDMYVYNRLLNSKLKDEKKSNEELRQVYLAVGGVLNHFKATGVKIKDLAGAMPRGLATIKEDIGYVKQSVTRTLTLDPVMRQHRTRKSRIDRVVSIMKQRGIKVGNIKDFYGEKLYNKDTKHAYKNSSSAKDKANNYLSHALKEDLQRVEAIDEYMMKRVLHHEKRINGNGAFEGKSFSADALTNTILIKDTSEPNNYKRIPYSFDGNGYMVFNGEVSLLNAMEKQKTQIRAVAPKPAPAAPKKVERTIDRTDEEKNELERLSLGQRELVVKNFRANKQRTFYIDDESNKDFLSGKRDTIIIQNGGNPSEKKEVRLSSKIEVNPDGSTREVYYASFMDKDRKPTKQQGFFMLDNTGIIKWSKNPSITAFLDLYKYRPVSKKETQDVATLLGKIISSTNKDKSISTSVEEKILNKPFLWSTTPNLQMIKITSGDTTREVPVIKNEKGELQVIFHPNDKDRIYTLPLTDEKAIALALSKST